MSQGPKAHIGQLPESLQFSDPIVIYIGFWSLEFRVLWVFRFRVFSPLARD